MGEVGEDGWFSHMLAMLSMLRMLREVLVMVVRVRENPSPASVPIVSSIPGWTCACDVWAKAATDSSTSDSVSSPIRRWSTTRGCPWPTKNKKINTTGYLGLAKKNVNLVDKLSRNSPERLILIVLVVRTIWRRRRMCD